MGYIVSATVTAKGLLFSSALFSYLMGRHNALLIWKAQTRRVCCNWCASCVQASPDKLPILIRLCPNKAFMHRCLAVSTSHIHPNVRGRLHIPSSSNTDNSEMVQAFASSSVLIHTAPTPPRHNSAVQHDSPALCIYVYHIAALCAALQRVVHMPKYC